MALPDLATAHYLRQAELSRLTVTAARTNWNRLGVNNLDRSWIVIRARLVVLLSAMQRSAAQDAITYIPAVLDELGIDASPAGRPWPGAFSGFASDGRQLDTLLDGAIVHTKELLGRGASSTEALTAGRHALDRLMATQVADAGRNAATVAITARPAVTGYVRMLSVPACARCAVLAGKWFRWNTGFARHPRCDCRHIPATENIAGDLRTDTKRALDSGKITGLTRADQAAIDDGADIGQVVNAHRGMSGTRRARGGRVTPEDITTQAATREQAIGLLRRARYLR